MVIKVLSRYKKGAPKEALREDEERIIKGGPLYPDLVESLQNCSISPVTRRTTDFMSIHLVEFDDLRKYVELALTAGKYINSQWCNGNKHQGIQGVFACDSYVVSASLYFPKERRKMDAILYVKMCLTETGNTVAVISLHESTK